MTDAEAPGDLLAGKAGRDQLHDLALPRRQLGSALTEQQLFIL
jgi:hypothetical protein